MNDDLLILRLRAISVAFDAGSKVELKFSAELGPRTGELYLRVAAADAAYYEIGDLYAAQLVRVSPSRGALKWPTS